MCVFGANSIILKSCLQLEFTKTFNWYSTIEEPSTSELILYKASINPQDHGVLVLYLKLAKVDVGNVSKKGDNMEVIIT